MRNRMTRLMLFTSLLTGLFVLPALADLGLQKILSEQGVVAVGKAVQSAVKAIYASTDDPALIQSQITEIINEAAATGDGEAVRYAIVAVMEAGGVANLSLSKAAIDNSAAFTDFPKITAFTVAAAESLISKSSAESGGDEESGGGGGESGGATGDEGGGDSDDELGGGDDDNPLEDGDEADIIDEDSDATPI